MNYKYFIAILFSFLLFSCNQSTTINAKKNVTNINERYKNTGFALIYDNNLSDIKVLDSESLSIYHKSLKKKIYCKNIKSRK